MVLSKGQEGELPKLDGLCFVQGGEGGSVDVVGISAIAEDLKKGQMGRVICRFGESLDLWCLKELCEYEGVWGGSCSCDEVGGSAG